MTDAIPFNRVLNLTPGAVDEVVPGVRRILADNPGPFTFKGTLSYIIGRGKVAIVDPGPDDAAHRAALLDAVRGESVTHIIITHTHRDHSPGAAAIKAATGAPTFAEGPHRPARPLHLGETSRLDAGGDTAFMPDHRVAHGDVIAGDGWALEVVATPGHTANHMAYALKGTEVLFSGDHVMGWSTSIVAPPDGAMRDYMASLHRLAARPETVYLAGHGDVIRDAPDLVARYIAHRRAREAAILRGLGEGETDIAGLVRAIYVGLDPRLVGAAALSALAHLEDLVARGVVSTDGAPSLSGRYRLPD
jgi:glyoxylase-like metal-dependent hydrolase (beta-lactamase superfamily II)